MNNKEKHQKILLTTIGVFSLANILCKNKKIGKIIAATSIVTVGAGITYCVIEEVKDKRSPNKGSSFIFSRNKNNSLNRNEQKEYLETGTLLFGKGEIIMENEITETEKVLKDMGKQIKDILVRDGYITETKMCEIIGLCPPPYSDYYGMVLVDETDILRM